MWRVQVWNEEHIVEAFLLDKEEDARMKEEELRETYFQPEYTIKSEQTPSLDMKFTRKGKIVKGMGDLLQAIVDLMPPGGF
ncbi:hypothetical protein [Alicyclobacillus sp. SO9]|uniref:hypothetical protein n=1 Tax=Alicyclobacillus sp. SO9 TaxID=2665646 RepID=UPI0018E81504|nr:hypothetical protein [Alicyclobacillus sp. SO9]QQE80492.1 hypothetical protein GI364_08815 [Alicyclobacillus sp. SO9]